MIVVIIIKNITLLVLFLEILLLDLNTLLGRTLVQSALHLIDHGTIKIYTNKPKTLQIAEIFELRSSPEIVRLLINLNYCTCRYFKNEVLLKEEPTSRSYTCKHVLALYFALGFKHKCLVYEEVPTQRLELLSKYFLPETTTATD